MTADQESKKVKKSPDEAATKPSQYKTIKANKPFGDCPVFVDDQHDHQSCDCDPDKPDPCGKDSDCINRTLMLECRPGVCKAGDKCMNMQFQRQKYPGIDGDLPLCLSTI
jgi:hypothetical protein